MSNKNNGMNKAKEAKKDEFYTQLTDIEKEMKYYREYFKNKVVFCNCDDPEWSNFWRYFNLNFEFLGLKRLISTHYQEEKSSYMLEMYRDGTGTHTEIRTLKGNGDFRSEECIELLKQADVVVTNPPFSLFRQYVAQLVEYKKDFIIIGRQTSVTCKDIFPLLKADKIWWGYSIHSGDREFRVPDDYPLTAAGVRIDAEGNKYIRVKGVRWYTNVDHEERHEDLILCKKYSPEQYPHYDNYDAIEVGKTKDIPVDYDGIMGVPVTFLDKYNPNQFEILGASEQCGRGLAGDLWDKESKVAHPLINGKRGFSRIFIKRKASADEN